MGKTARSDSSWFVHLGCDRSRPLRLVGAVRGCSSGQPATMIEALADLHDPETVVTQE